MPPSAAGRSVHPLFPGSASRRLNSDELKIATECGHAVYDLCHRSSGVSPQTARHQGDESSPPSCSPPGSRTAIPTINGGRIRVDQMESCGHYKHWRSRLRPGRGARASASCATARRCTAPGSAPGRYDWEFADETFARPAAARHHADRRPLPLRRARLARRLPEPGLPAALRATTPRAFAERYPWVQLYTPVNEMFICAIFSATYGWWNEQLHDATAPSSPRSSTSSRPTCWRCRRS